MKSTDSFTQVTNKSTSLKNTIKMANQLWHVRYVVSHLPKKEILNDIEELILVRNLLNVKYVVIDLPINVLLKVTCKSIQVIHYLNVIYVGNSFHRS